MHTLRHIALAALFAAAAFEVAAVSPYPELEAKAARLTQYAEWNGAAAIYTLMLDQRPDLPQTYGQAITVNGIRGDSTAQVRLMDQAVANHMAFDSVFSQVRRWSFYWGKPQVYEHFLESMRDANPWMRRNINATLLRYYDFRCNAPRMIEYADMMLTSAPDNANFLMIKARGYLLLGLDNQALAIYRQVLSSDPDNYRVLLILGNYYAEHPHLPHASSLAATYLTQAQRLRPTPYVATLLAKCGQ